MIKTLIDKLIYYLTVIVLIISLPLLLFTKILRSKKKLVCFYYIPQNVFNVNRFEKHAKHLTDDFKIVYSMTKLEFNRYKQCQGYFQYFYLNLKICLVGVIRLFKYSNYHNFWIQRRFIAHYDFPSNIFEWVIKLLKINLIMDYYDADILRNEKLYSKLGKISNHITVSNENLKALYTPICDSVMVIPLKIDESNYSMKKDYDKKIIVGWMGSESNSKGLEYHENNLIEFKRLFPQIQFEFICSKRPNLTRLNFKHFTFEEIQCSTWISSITFGLSLYDCPTDSLKRQYLKCKSPFKTLEYLFTKTIVISDEFGTYHGMKKYKHFLPIDELKTEKFSNEINSILKNRLMSPLIKNGTEFYENINKNNKEQLVKMIA